MRSRDLSDLSDPEVLIGKVVISINDPKWVELSYMKDVRALSPLGVVTDHAGFVIQTSAESNST